MNHKYQSEDQSGGFLMGLIFGGIIAAVIAIVIYRNKDSEVIAQFKEKITEIFNNLVNSEKKTKKKVIALAAKSKSKVKKAVHLPKKFFKKDL